jgi:hypothetical protein
MVVRVDTSCSPISYVCSQMYSPVPLTNANLQIELWLIGTLNLLPFWLSLAVGVALADTGVWLAVCPVANGKIRLCLHDEITTLLIYNPSASRATVLDEHWWPAGPLSTVSSVNTDECPAVMRTIFDAHKPGYCVRQCPHKGCQGERHKTLTCEGNISGTVELRGPR